MIFRKKRPEPKYLAGELVMIKAEPGSRRPIVRYMIVRKRRWIKLDAEWVYDGPVLIAISNDGVIVIRMYVEGVSETKLGKVANGDLGLAA